MGVSLVFGRRTKGALNLGAGELVEIRSKEEILATLDERGRLEALPFMPEMLKHCGKQVRVFKSAHKTCDTIGYQGARQLEHTVHLGDLRCDGAAHGGCQAGCLLFWREAWVKRVDERGAAKASPRSTAPAASVTGSRCTERHLNEATRAEATQPADDADIAYSCQATELNRASTELPWWDFRQYVRDLRSGNVRFRQILAALAFWFFTKMINIGPYRLLMWSYEKVQKRRGGIPYPFKAGSCDKTPSATLQLRPGEMVRVKSQDEILGTVNRRNRNRGLSFDEEMVEFCGRTYPVLKRIDKIINERTGKLMKLPNDCIVLDGVTCQARFKNKRLFCPRHIYPYWREIWLERVASESKESTAR